MNSIENFNQMLSSFKIKATCLEVHQVGNFTYYDVKLAPGIKVKILEKYGDEISLALQSPRKPTIKIMHELGLVRLEFIQHQSGKPLNLIDMLYDTTIEEKPAGGLVCLLGQSVDGRKVWMDLADNPHLLVAGTTGSGKSTLLHNILANILYTNNVYSCNVFCLDPKNIEFHQYNKSEHPYLKNLVVKYSFREAMLILDEMLWTMEARYEQIKAGMPLEQIPYSLLIIDEYADLIMQDIDNQFYLKVCRLAQKCRAAKISIILATQRPSVNVLNGSIKANFPARIACHVPSHHDSKVILDSIGAEHLLGKGDALVRDNFRYLERMQIAYADAKETIGMMEKRYQECEAVRLFYDYKR